MITVVQRFGSDLALDVHFHIVLDGVYDAGGFTLTTTIAAHRAHVRRLVVSGLARHQRRRYDGCASRRLRAALLDAANVRALT